MRASLAFVICIAAGFVVSQQVNDPPQHTLEVVVDEIIVPQGVAVGQECNVAVHVKSKYARVELANVRLELPTGYELVAPAIEQLTFVGPDETSVLTWRVKRIAEANKGEFLVSPVLLLHGRSNEGSGAGSLKAVLERTWKGRYSDPAIEFDSVLTIKVRENGSVDGKVVWTNVETNTEEQKKNIGKSGTEFLHGSFDARKRELVLEGYRRDDPTHMIGLDLYTLTMDKNARKMIGKSRNGGLGGSKWTLEAD